MIFQFGLEKYGLAYFLHSKLEGLFYYIAENWRFDSHALKLLEIAQSFWTTLFKGALNYEKLHRSASERRVIWQASEFSKVVSFLKHNIKVDMAIKFRHVKFFDFIRTKRDNSIHFINLIMEYGVHLLIAKKIFERYL